MSVCKNFVLGHSVVNCGSHRKGKCRGFKITGEELLVNGEFNVVFSKFYPWDASLFFFFPSIFGTIL